VAGLQHQMMMQHEARSSTTYGLINSARNVNFPRCQACVQSLIDRCQCRTRLSSNRLNRCFADEHFQLCSANAHLSNTIRIGLILPTIGLPSVCFHTTLRNLEFEFVAMRILSFTYISTLCSKK